MNEKKERMSRMTALIHTYTRKNTVRGVVATSALAVVLALPGGAFAQSPNSASTTQDNTPQAAQAQQQPDINQQRLSNASHEGFWGHLNPFARKKWVQKRLQPIHDQLDELDQVNAKNAQDIKDVDARAQAGIHQAQSTADSANQTATAAGQTAQGAQTAAQGASSHVDQLNTTVNGLDQYRSVSETDVRFGRGVAVLSVKAKGQLDDLIQSINGRKGYIIDIEAHSPAHGAAGIQDSQKFAEAINRYLVEHNIPVYRLHAVAMGNAKSEDSDEPVRVSMARVRLMENSLAAPDAASPQGAAAASGAERP
jgi:outer membrane protein OmpA-like peptidoglycan-associated protein